MQRFPKDEYGHIITSAEFGQAWLVQIIYNTDPTGKWVDGNLDDSNRTLHGPFRTVEEAVEWMDAYPDGDTDIYDMDAICFNRVVPELDDGQKKHATR